MVVYRNDSPRHELEHGRYQQHNRHDDGTNTHSKVGGEVVPTRDCEQYNRSNADLDRDQQGKDPVAAVYLGTMGVQFLTGYEEFHGLHPKFGLAPSWRFERVEQFAWSAGLL
jgi:hypothetical protein